MLPYADLDIERWLSECLALLLAGGLVWVAASASAAAPAPAATGVAVLDFTEAGNDKPDHLGVGLADLVESELTTRGIAVYDRRSLHLLLGERALARGGLLDGGPEIVHTALPSVRFLVTGIVQRQEGQRFRLTVAAVDTTLQQTGLSATASGLLPKELTTAVSRAAGDLAHILRTQAKLPDTASAAARPKPFGDQQPSPEQALLFYRAMEYFANGRSEFAAACFRQLHQEAPQLRLIHAWQVRALQALGLVELANALETEPRCPNCSSPGGKSAETRKVEELRYRGAARPCLVVPSLAELPAAFVTGLRAGVSQDARVALFDPAWITPLVGEQDLRLSGDFASFAGFDGWLLADLVLVCRALPGNPAGRKLQLVDALTGAVRAAVEVSATGTVGEPDGNETARALIAALLKAPAEGLSEHSGMQVATDAKVDPRHEWIAWYARAGWGGEEMRCAQILRVLALAPRDPYLLLLLARQTEFFSPLMDARRVQLAIDAIRQNPEMADGAALLATALSEPIRRGVYCWPVTGWAESQRLGDVFQELLKLYPDSLAAMAVRFSHIQETLAQDPAASQTTALEAFVKALETAVPPPGDAWQREGNNVINTLKVNSLYCLASEYVKSRQGEKALEALDRAAEVVRQNPYPQLWRYPLLTMAGDGQFDLFGVASRAQGQVACLRELTLLRSQVKDPLRAGVSGPSALRLTPSQLCEKACQSEKDAAIRLHLDSLRELAATPGGYVDLKEEQRALYQVEWLYPRMPDKAELLQVTDRLIARQPTPRWTFDLYMATGRMAAAAQVLASGDWTPPHGSPFARFRSRLEWLFYNGKSAEIVAFLDHECAALQTVNFDDLSQFDATGAIMRLMAAQHYLALGCPEKARNVVQPLLRVTYTADNVEAWRGTDLRICDTVLFYALPWDTRKAAQLCEAYSWMLEGKMLDAAEALRRHEKMVEQTHKLFNTQVPYWAFQGYAPDALGLVRNAGCCPTLFTWRTAQAAPCFDRTGAMPPELVCLFRTLFRQMSEIWQDSSRTELARRGETIWPYALRPLVLLPPGYSYAPNWTRTAIRPMPKPNLAIETVPVPALPFWWLNASGAFAGAAWLFDWPSEHAASEQPWLLCTWTFGSNALAVPRLKEALEGCLLPPPSVQPMLVQLLGSPDKRLRQGAAYLLARQAKLEFTRDGDGLPDETGVATVKAHFEKDDGPPPTGTAGL